MSRFAGIIAVLLSTLTSVDGQWKVLLSPTTADLRGIDSVSPGIAWASGSNGTILRTIDGGAHWTSCVIPTGADQLDFRGIQGFDAQHAVVMSNGRGGLSRLYQTSDGCKTWTLVFTNPDADGSFVSMRATYRRSDKDPALMLLGDPVHGRFRLWSVKPFATSGRFVGKSERLQQAMKGEIISSASNSSLFLIVDKLYFLFGTGGPEGARIIRRDDLGEDSPGTAYSDVPIGGETDTSGVSSIAVELARGSTLHRWWRPYIHDDEQLLTQKAVAVGGDYHKPDDATAVAAYCDGFESVWKGMIWHAAKSQPHGYRSAVAYDIITSTWVAVGPNGTDISTDSGRNWYALKPSSTDTADADRNWNALSLPYVVGPNGRIGKLNRKLAVP